MIKVYENIMNNPFISLESVMTSSGLIFRSLIQGGTSLTFQLVLKLVEEASRPEV
jgi:hypothetical protein